MSFKIYIEGGGDNRVLDSEFREAWTQFFRAAGLGANEMMPRIVRGKGRLHTFELFATAVANPHDQRVPLLLVDSEDPVKPGHSVWQHLMARDSWKRPEEASDNQAFLMVQVMETWFLADTDVLLGFFGNNLLKKHLPKWPKLEDVAKTTVFEALENATARCQTPYAKGKVSFRLLGKLKPERVADACPHAMALLERLRGQ